MTFRHYFISKKLCKIADVHPYSSNIKSHSLPYPYLNEAVSYLHGLDAIVIMLGTNDCKAVFTDSLNLVPENMKTLILKITYWGVKY